jgi:hypothetical protein
MKSTSDKGVKVGTMAGSIHGWRGGLWRAFGLTAALCGPMTMASCHSAVTEGRAASYLIIDTLEGAAPTKAGQAVTTFDSKLDSDVITNGTVFEDVGRVTMRMALKDITTPTGPSTNNQITVTRYRVEYRRTDGRNREGVDVPYSFEGGATFTVGDGQVTHGFVLVRLQAKLEAPLITLRFDPNVSGALAINTIADVTFYGKDQTGTEVTVKGSISVNFADWGDPAN